MNTQRVFAIVAPAGPREKAVASFIVAQTKTFLGPAGAPNAKMRWAFTAAHIATVRVTMAFRTCLLESYVTTRANGIVGTAY